MLILRAIKTLESVCGIVLDGRVREGGNHVGGADVGSADGEMNAGGEERIHEASRIADQEIARPNHLRGGVGPITNGHRLLDGLAIAHHRRRAWGGGNLLKQKTLQAGFSDRFGTEVSIHHRADAGEAAGKRYLPKPALREGLDEDVALVRRIKMIAIAKVAIHGQIAKVGVPDFQLELVGQERCLAAGIHDHSGGDASAIFQDRRRRSVAIEDDIRHGHALFHHGTALLAVLQENLVEARAPDLVGVGIAAVGFAEVPAPRFRALAPAHGGTPLLGEPLGGHRRQDADFLKDGERRWQQGLANVGAGKGCALEHANVETGPRQQTGHRAAGRTAADDQGIYVLRCFFHRLVGARASRRHAGETPALPGCGLEICRTSDSAWARVPVMLLSPCPLP